MLSSYVQLLKQIQCFEMSMISLRLWPRYGENSSFEFQARYDICGHVPEGTYVEPTSLHNPNFAELPKPLDESARSVSFGETPTCHNPADILRARPNTGLVVTIQR